MDEAIKGVKNDVNVAEIIAALLIEGL